jgi:histidine triad (HIT) family protein
MMSVETQCIFCRIIRGEIPSQRVYEDDRVIAFRDIQPQAPTHLLVVPRAHVASLSDLSSEDVDLAGALLLAARHVALQEGLSASGYRIITNSGTSAGQTVFHLHLHVLGGRPLGSLG